MEDTKVPTQDMAVRLRDLILDMEDQRNKHQTQAMEDQCNKHQTRVTEDQVYHKDLPLVIIDQVLHKDLPLVTIDPVPQGHPQDMVDPAVIKDQTDPEDITNLDLHERSHRCNYQ